VSQNPVITVIGAASTTFGPKVLRDILNHPEVGGCTFRFVDTNEERLQIYDRLAHRISDLLETPIEILSTPDRRAALPGSDYVIVSVDTGHYRTWQQDFSIPARHGVRQVLGELGGPGGMLHAFRQIPLHLTIGWDVEALCPEATVMVCSNPLNRICLAMDRYTGVGPVFGLCHGVEMALYLFLNRVMDIDGDDMDVTAAGVNHFTWILDLRRKSTGEDLDPLMRDALRELPADQQPLSRKLLDVYGYFPGCLDTHIGEYIPYAYEYCGLGGPNFDGSLEQEEKRWEYLGDLSQSNVEWDRYEQIHGDQSVLSEELRLDPFFQPRSWADTLAFPIIAAAISNRAHRMPAINLPNAGAIDNLPRGVYVETPGLADASGVLPLAVGPLPEPLAAFCRRDIDQMELTVDAAVTGDRNLALQAMLLDPVVDSVRNAERALDEMLESNTEYLPQF